MNAARGCGVTGPDVIGLFEGYGGLTMATLAQLGGRLVGYSEIEPAACRLLAHHHPDVPNLGDVTQVDWAAAPRTGAPLVLTGGFPCQDVSSAGRRAGIRVGTRSGLWSHFADAIDALRPELVVIENVRGLLSAHADSAMEPCSWCVGNGPGSGLRALGAVLGDLVDLGYDARWCGLRAADVGAPHGRFRIFVTAWPAADTDRDAVRHEPVSVARSGGAAVAGSAVQDADRAARGERRVAAPREAEAGRARPDAGRRGGAPATDTCRPRREGPLSQVGVSIGQREASLGPGAPAAERGGAAADTDRDGLEGRQERDLGTEAGQPAPLGGDPARRVLDWGDYAPAIHRWEHILGRVAPGPTMTGKRGGQQLSPLFVEWMQGLPAGHVTAVPGLSRNEQLKLLGNGVVPQQAAAAMRHLLAPALAPHLRSRP